MDGLFVFAMPYSKDSAMTFVDYRDVAEVAVMTFASDEVVNGTFELAAGGMCTRIELASLMSCHAERDVAAVDVDPDVALGDMPDGPVRSGLTAIFGANTAHGFDGGHNLVLTSILGRPPRTLDAFPVPPDVPACALTVARPDQDDHLPHIGLVGDANTILVGGVEVTFRDETVVAREGETIRS